MLPLIYWIQVIVWVELTPATSYSLCL